MKYNITGTSIVDGICTITVTVTHEDGSISNPTLSVVEYITPPEDGVQEINLTANWVRPGTMVTQAEVTFEGISVSFLIPEWYSGFRITGAQMSNDMKTI